MHYRWLIVGAGLFGAVFAREMKNKGVSCAVIDRRSHIAGNIYTEKRNGIHVHRYGAHIFHTSDKEVWEYVQQFAEFNQYINSPVARYGDRSANRRTSKSRLCLSSDAISMKSLSRATRRSSGAGTARSCPPLSSAGSRSGLSTTTTILMTGTRESRSADIPRWLKKCWRASR